MGLKQVGININEKDWEALGNGRGQIVRDLIKSYLAHKDNDTIKIDEEVLRRKKQTLENKKVQVVTELESINSTLNHIKEDRERNELEQLEEEKENALKLVKCIGCHQVLDDKTHKKKFNKGLVCMHCFLKADSKQISEWS
eukprot:GHVU01108317.1.p1 GENE.GHVU01108317.1~~GHVU01108317.1.p1  ORF type:complete len:141 (+),score=18.83 GHVU01108317.1:601-1023(+)